MKFFYSDNDIQNMVYQLDSECGVDYYFYQVLRSHIKARFGQESADVLDQGSQHFTDDQYRIVPYMVGYNLWRDILCVAIIDLEEKIDLGL